MALNKRASRRETLIREAAKDVRLLNPHIGAAQESEDEAQYSEVEQARQELERVWDEMARQLGATTSDEPAAQAVDEDRGD